MRSSFHFRKVKWKTHNHHAMNKPSTLSDDKRPKINLHFILFYFIFKRM